MHNQSQPLYSTHTHACTHTLTHTPLDRHASHRSSTHSRYSNPEIQRSLSLLQRCYLTNSLVTKMILYIYYRSNIEILVKDADPHIHYNPHPFHDYNIHLLIEWNTNLYHTLLCSNLLQLLNFLHCRTEIKTEPILCF